MCGIAGIVNAEGLDAPCHTLVKSMCDVIVHRGPDDEGYHFSSHAGLGIRRLSIIDLQTGHQPVFSEDRSVAVVLNGEIFNFRELRSQLLERGHRFSTAGDTETIVHLYEDYGDACVEHLRGMFSFALWDEKRRRLLLARDRLGIKPLFYWTQAGRLAFGSELKCFRQDPTFHPRVNPGSLAEYLTFLYVLAPKTIFEGVSELPPAHVLTWDSGEIHLRRYWQLQYQADGGHSENYYVEGLTAKLADAVSSHLVSDVPLGAFLSGGLDSGLMLALMTAAANTPAETFTVGFEGDYGFYDERSDARRVAVRYRSRHHEFLVRPDLHQVLPKIIEAFDQPLADSSAVPNYYICKLARSRVTVALSGLGGDELAGGYERYLGVLLGQKYQSLPATLRSALARAIGWLPDAGGKGRFSVSRLQRFVRSAQKDPAEAYARLLFTFDPDELQDLLVGDWRSDLAHYSPLELIRSCFETSGSQSPVNRMLFVDTTHYLPGDLLPLTDRMSMAHSLEVRVPFLDHKLMEFAAGIPPEIKIRGLTKKYLLKRVAEPLLPPETLAGAKRGFSIPLAFWFRKELKAFVQEQLSAEKIDRMGYFHPHRVRAILQEHFSMRANHENKIWALLVFGLWHDLVFEHRAPEPRPTPARVTSS